MRTVQGDMGDVPVVTAEVRWKPGAQASCEAISAAWDVVMQAVAAADVSLRASHACSKRLLLYAMAEAADHGDDLG